MRAAINPASFIQVACIPKVAANEARWGIKEILIPSKTTIVDSTMVGSADGKSRALTCIPVRKVAAWLTTIEPGKVKSPEARARVIQYQNECDDALWQYWNDGLAVNPRATYAVNPGDVLTKEQAETLRDLVIGTAKKLSADTAVQGDYIRMAWTKLKSHFKVSYRQIPQHELTEAISLINRHTAEWEVVDEVPAPKTNLDDAVRLQHAFTLASQTAAKVQQAVFNGVMSGNADWQRSRYLLNLDVEGRDQEVVVRARQVEHNACVAPIDRFHDVIEESITVDAQTLSQLASTCMARLSRMAQRAVPAATQAIGATA